MCGPRKASSAGSRCMPVSAFCDSAAPKSRAARAQSRFERSQSRADLDQALPDRLRADLARDRIDLDQRLARARALPAADVDHRHVEERQRRAFAVADLAQHGDDLLVERLRDVERPFDRDGIAPARSAQPRRRAGPRASARGRAPPRRQRVRPVGRRAREAPGRAAAGYRPTLRTSPISRAIARPSSSTGRASS